SALGLLLGGRCKNGDRTPKIKGPVPVFATRCWFAKPCRIASVSLQASCLAAANHKAKPGLILAAAAGFFARSEDSSHSGCGELGANNRVSLTFSVARSLGRVYMSPVSSRTSELWLSSGVFSCFCHAISCPFLPSGCYAFPPCLPMKKPKPSQRPLS